MTKTTKTAKKTNEPTLSDMLKSANKQNAALAESKEAKIKAILKEK